jgi:hypothetical protein
MSTMDKLDNIHKEIQHLLTIKAKYDKLMQKRAEINKVSWQKWRENIDDETFKEKRKVANKKYADKKKLERSQKIL